MAKIEEPVFLLGFALMLVSHSLFAAPQKKNRYAPPSPEPSVAASPQRAQQEDPSSEPKESDEKLVSRPSTGGMIQQATVARHLHETGKLWEAAAALSSVAKGETGDDERSRQLASFNLAKVLYELHFYQAAYNIFSSIADNPSHIKFKETLLWLAKLADDLPEPAGVAEQIGKYQQQELSRFNNPSQQEIYWKLRYYLGRYAYDRQQYEDAILLFDGVEQSSSYFARAQFFKGISNVQLKKSIPALGAFQHVVDEAGNQVELRDLAFLSMARTYYSASIYVDDKNVPTIDAQKLSAAIKYWNKVDVASEYWLDALFEESWAYFMAGDYARALGNIHTINAPYFPNAYYPEAKIIKAVIYFANCRYEDAASVVARFQEEYQPIYKELSEVLERFQGENQEENLYQFLKNVKENKVALSPKIKPIVELSLSDRQLLRHLNYINMLEEENKRLQAAPTSFRKTGANQEIQDAVQHARAAAVKKIGQLVVARYQRNLDELNEQIRNSSKIQIDVIAARRNQLDEETASMRVSADDSKRNIVKTDSEHEIWRFNGEYWRDELGFYRTTIPSQCGQ
ncbi:hypothetical protein [Pajaroellobacter abortibovis]|uniref:Uncharacterized protein n=1 Tax=Pajaroellobacter abortibovis TaxID=1882918 RepID=A0A1L6MVK9_9BACT|nr:hypothetical protein [Pajaroellobacter abortibovis]APR99518.1 hypothetical protein BCY86_01610 [Pajaroellobacter abortibovis]